MFQFSGGGTNTVEIEVVIQTLSADQNNIIFNLTKGKIPKAVVLESLTEPENRVLGEIYYANCFDKGGFGKYIHLSTRRDQFSSYERRTTSTTANNAVVISENSVMFTRVSNNCLFPAETIYQLTCFYWDNEKEATE